jgi:hypothetical protein
VQKGDFIGITNLTACGTATFRATGFPGSTAQVAGDMQGSGAFVNRSEYLLPYSLELHASADSEPPSVVNFLPVAISAPGRAGAFFRTRVQLRNPRGTPISGHLVFHPAFAQATASDPPLGYSLGPWEVRTIDDLVAAMGQTGIGSIDVVPDNSEDQGPTVQASVYSSSSAGGVFAFGEPTIRPAEVAIGGGALIGPTDPTSTRWNIGVRTFEAGATVEIVIFDSNGIGRSLITRTYPPNYFEQVPASAVLDGQEPGPDMTLVFSVTSGSAIVYGVTADNFTQSSVFRLAGREF